MRGSEVGRTPHAVRASTRISNLGRNHGASVMILLISLFSRLVDMFFRFWAAAMSVHFTCLNAVAFEMFFVFVCRACARVPWKLNATRRRFVGRSTTDEIVRRVGPEAWVQPSEIIFFQLARSCCLFIRGHQSLSKVKSLRPEESRRAPRYSPNCSGSRRLLNRRDSKSWEGAKEKAHPTPHQLCTVPRHIPVERTIATQNATTHLIL